MFGCNRLLDDIEQTVHGSVWVTHRCRRREQEGMYPPPQKKKIGKKISGNYHVRFGHLKMFIHVFSGKKS